MKSLATIFALAALIVPAAHAGGPPPMSDVQLSRTVRVQQPDVIERYVRTHAVAPISDVQLSRYGSRSAAPVPSTPTVGGFDWADFSIGAVAMLGAALLAVAAALAVRNTRGKFQSA